MSIASVAAKRIISGRQVLLVLASAFAVVFAVNFYMAYLAISTFSGLDGGGDAYRAGVDYNRTIAESEAQTALGWTAHFSSAPDRKGFDFELVDRAGAPVHGLIVAGKLERPSTDRFDRKLTFVESTPGRYLAAFDAPIDPGNWVVSLTAVVDASTATFQRFQFRQRLWLK